MAERAETIWSAAGSLAVLGVLGAVVFSISSCVRRDWAFEDRCRVAGGAVVYASSVGQQGGQVCAKPVQSPAYQIIPVAR
jgi:hypothetical protein